MITKCTDSGKTKIVPNVSRRFFAKTASDNGPCPTRTATEVSDAFVPRSIEAPEVAADLSVKLAEADDGNKVAVVFIICSDAVCRSGRRLSILTGFCEPDRYVPLTAVMVEELLAFWKTHRHPRWLFPAPARAAAPTGTCAKNSYPQSGSNGFYTVRSFTGELYQIEYHSQWRFSAHFNRRVITDQLVRSVRFL